MKLSKSLVLLFSAIFMLIVLACGGGGGGGSSDSVGTGTLDVSLTDSAGSYKAVYITIEGIEVHIGGNENSNKSWVTIPMDKDTINLCELTNGVFEKIGSLRLASGNYNQLRLHLVATPEDNELNILSELHPAANYVVLEDNTWQELKIPSGFQSGIKIVKGFSINENETTEIILDFDALRSVVEAGNSGQWLLKPIIRVGELKEYSIIYGRVTDDSVEGIVIPNAMVSVQKYDSTADDKDKVIVQAATITDENGDYSIFVKPDTYYLVAYADGKEIASERIETVAGNELEDESITYFQLVGTATGNIEGEVLINGGDDIEDHATISYRQNVTCDGCDPDEMIEVKSINVRNMVEYKIELPVDSYSRVASTFGYGTQTVDLDVIAGTNNQNIHDIQF